MEISVFRDGDKMLIKLAGRVVLDECDRLKATVLPLVQPGVSEVALDLSGVNFIDSAGLGVLVGMKVTSNKVRARLALVNPSKGVQDILTVSKLDSIFDILTGAEGDQLVNTLGQSQFAVDGLEQSADHQRISATSQTFQAPPAPGGQSAKEKIDKLCKTAVDYMRQRNYEDAVNCYKEVLEIDPDYLPAINNLGIVYEKKPEWQSLAVEQWEKVLQISQERGDQKHIERAQKHLQAIQNA